MTAPNLLNRIYDELGVRPVINGGGTHTIYGGARMASEVLEAMAEASRSFVQITDLNRAAGEYIAEVTGAEAGMVCSGAAGGIVLMTAACMTGTDAAKIHRLPDTTGMKDEVVTQRQHYGGFTHMHTYAGAKLVEVGTTTGCSPEDLASTIGPQTAAVAFLYAPGVHTGGMTLKDVTEIAHSREVPVIVDSAAMLPPKRNLKRPIAEGADMVTTSGGKFIGGPQATGLLYGRKDLIEAALKNANPHPGVGRPMKVSKEGIVGLVTALRMYVEADEEALLAEVRERAEYIAREVTEIPGLAVSVEQDEYRYFVPTTVIAFQPDWRGHSGPEIKEALISGDPPVYMNYDQHSNSLNVNPLNVQEGETEILARRLKEELEKGA